MYIDTLSFIHITTAWCGFDAWGLRLKCWGVSINAPCVFRCIGVFDMLGLTWGSGSSLDLMRF